jgi:hypothetical protein
MNRLSPASHPATAPGAVYPHNIRYRLHKEDNAVKVHVRLNAPDSGSAVLGPGGTLRIGSAHRSGGVALLPVPGRRCLSRRAVELFNTGSKLVIASHQRPGACRITVIDRSGRKDSQTLDAVPIELSPSTNLEITIDFTDSRTAQVRVSAVDDGGSPLPEFTAAERDAVDENEELLLLVNAIPLVAEADPGKLPAPTRVQELFLPSVSKSVHSTNTFRKATERLASHYGLRDPRALADMLERGRRLGHVTEALKARIRGAEGT